MLGHITHMKRAVGLQIAQILRAPISINSVVPLIPHFLSCGPSWLLRVEEHLLMGFANPPTPQFLSNSPEGPPSQTRVLRVSNMSMLCFIFKIKELSLNGANQGKYRKNQVYNMVNFQFSVSATAHGTYPLPYRFTDNGSFNREQSLQFYKIMCFKQESMECNVLI